MHLCNGIFAAFRKNGDSYDFSKVEKMVEIQNCVDKVLDGLLITDLLTITVFIIYKSN